MGYCYNENILFFAGSLSSSDLVAFLSGLLLGEDTKAKNWFSSFVRIGQRVSILNVLEIAIFFVQLSRFTELLLSRICSI